MRICLVHNHVTDQGLPIQQLWAMQQRNQTENAKYGGELHDRSRVHQTQIERKQKLVTKHNLREEHAYN